LLICTKKHDWGHVSSQSQMRYSRRIFDVQFIKIAVKPFPPSLLQTLRYVEWIFIAIVLGMSFGASSQDLPIVVAVNIVFFLLSWIFPWNFSNWQRLLYISSGIIFTIIAKSFGVDLGLFITIYLAKAGLLLNRRVTIPVAVFAIVSWTIVDYYQELHRSQRPIQPNPMFVLDPSNTFLYASATLLAYAAAGTFAIVVSGMALAEQESRQRAEELSQQVESLTATLERTRIAREIHDSLGHTLTDLDTQLAVAQVLRSHDLTQAFQAVDTAKLLARQCIEDVSHALTQMRQSDFDLNQALVTLLEQLRQTSTLQVEWKVNLPNLPIYQSYQIYCLVKEGLMNVQKHAQASQVNFLANETVNGIVLELKDNGVGFDLKAFNPGFGIQGMIERTQLLGGQFDIQSAFDRGTQIYITLPL
jgi:signal transduction histidine kinase